MENLLPKEEIEAIINGDHGNVFAVLGIHRDKGLKKVFIRCFQPFANEVEVIDAKGLMELREQVSKTYVHNQVYAYIVKLVQATRENPYIELGVSPRGTIGNQKGNQRIDISFTAGM